MLSSVLKSGEAYIIHGVFGLVNNPLVTGLYDKGTVSVPMGNIELPQPTRYPQNIEDNDHPHRKFATFVITHGGCQ